MFFLLFFFFNNNNKQHQQQQNICKRGTNLIACFVFEVFIFLIFIFVSKNVFIQICLFTKICFFHILYQIMFICASLHHLLFSLQLFCSIFFFLLNRGRTKKKEENHTHVYLTCMDVEFFVCILFECSTKCS